MSTPTPPPPPPSPPVPAPRPDYNSLVEPRIQHEEFLGPKAGKLFRPRSVVMPCAAFGMVIILGSYIYSSLSSAQWNARHTKDKMRDEARYGGEGAGAGVGGGGGGGRAERRRERGVDA